MSLNKSKGNMYGFVTHTWNAIKGVCPHKCTYCYMKRWGKQKPPHLDKSEFKTDLGTGNYIFVGSSIDMFSGRGIKIKWIMETLNYCNYFEKNKYFFQTKNPECFIMFKSIFPKNSTFCITLETNRHYPKIMQNCPLSIKRVDDFTFDLPGKKMITIEPVIDFDPTTFLKMINKIKPSQINIGADSGNNHLPEPTPDKLQEFISMLEILRYKVHIKPNLKRLLK